MRVFFTILILSTVFCACAKKPEPNPELNDPVYKIIQEKLALYEKQLSFNNKERKTLRKYIDETDPQDPMITSKRKTHTINEKERSKAIQQIQYAKIALEKRKKEVRIRYLKEFKKGNYDNWQNEDEIASKKARLENNDFLKSEY